MGHALMWALAFVLALAVPFALPAIATVLIVGSARRRREALEARDRVGRLGEGSRCTSD